MTLRGRQATSGFCRAHLLGDLRIIQFYIIYLETVSDATGWGLCLPSWRGWSPAPGGLSVLPTDRLHIGFHVLLDLFAQCPQDAGNVEGQWFMMKEMKRPVGAGHAPSRITPLSGSLGTLSFGAQ